MKLHLLIDTSVWLDLAKDHRQLPLLDALTTMSKDGDLALVLPRIVIEEFARNKDRIVAESKRSLSSHFKRVCEAVGQFSPKRSRDATLRQLHEIEHRIVMAGDAINDAIDLVEKLFASTPIIELTDVVKMRAADRAINKLAPFHRQRNGIDDAILIETYIDALATKRAEDVFGFVTHNTHDFSQHAGDTRLPHADLATLFDGSSSRYATNLGPLLSEFAGDLLEDFRFEREYNPEPRRLSELLEAEEKLTQQVWYNRKWVLIDSFERGKHKIVTREEWDKAKPRQRQGMTIDTIWEGMHAAMRQTEEELGLDQLGPWDTFEWGMINGKLSAIRWVLGDEWDMLDT